MCVVSYVYTLFFPWETKVEQLGLKFLRPVSANILIFSLGYISLGKCKYTHFFITRNQPLKLHIAKRTWLTDLCWSRIKVSPSMWPVVMPQIRKLLGSTSYRYLSDARYRLLDIGPTSNCIWSKKQKNRSDFLYIQKNRTDFLFIIWVYCSFYALTANASLGICRKV